MKKVQKRNLLPWILLSLSLVLLLVYLLWIRPLVNTKPETPPPDTRPGEDVLSNRVMLYDQIKREDIYRITVHNKNVEFCFKRGKDMDLTSDFVLSILEGDKYQDYPHITYNQAAFSSLVVGVGTTYIRDRVMETGVTEEDLKKYGLAASDDPTCFEIFFRKAAEDGSHRDESVKVYVGNEALTGAGYYLRLEGRDIVYVSFTPSVGQLTASEPAAFVDPVLTSPLDPNGAYSYYYNQAFTIFRRTEERGASFGKEDTVRARYQDVTEPDLPVEIATFDLRDMQEAGRNIFLSHKVGDGDFTFTVTYPENHEEHPGETRTYRVIEILSADILYIRLDFLNESERNIFHSGVAYQITAPAEKTSYLASSGNYMQVLEDTGYLMGSETVAVGLTKENMEKFGLGAYTIYYEAPVGISYDSKNENDIVVSYYLPIYLYISEKQADGSYYVGSLFTDRIAKVEAEEGKANPLDFLQKEDTYWLKETMLSVNVLNLRHITFRFNYLDESLWAQFVITTRKEEKSGKEVFDSVSYLDSNGVRKDGMEPQIFSKLYLNLLEVYYRGEYDGSLPKEEVMAGRSVLTISLTLKDGTSYEYQCYPYSARHLLVSVGKTGEEAGAYFYITADEVEKLYGDVITIRDGGTPDPDKRY